MKSVFLALALLFSVNDWTPQEQQLAKSNSRQSKMSSIEQDVLFYLNLARINPKKFKKEVLIPYLKEHTDYSNKYTRTLKRDLDKLKPQKPLKYTDELYNFAKHHAKSTGKVGRVGHRSVLFKSYKSRSKKLLSTYSYVGENIHYGSNNAKRIVIDLLIDDGIKDVGHRKNMLSDNFVFASVSIQPHKKYRQNCVIEFGGALNK